MASLIASFSSYFYTTVNVMPCFQELYYFGCLLLLFVNFILQTIVAGRVLPSVDSKQLDKIMLIAYGSCVLAFHVYFILRVYMGVRVKCITTIFML